MIDDELDRLLQDIDSEKDYTIQKGHVKQFTEHTLDSEFDETALPQNQSLIKKMYQK